MITLNYIVVVLQAHLLHTSNSKESSTVGLPDTNKNLYENLGYIAAVEKRFGFKNVDVGFDVNGKKTAVEVVPSPDHLIENLQRDFEARCEQVLIAVPNLRAIPSYQERIQARNKNFLDKVELKVLTEFLT